MPIPSTSTLGLATSLGALTLLAACGQTRDTAATNTNAQESAMTNADQTASTESLDSKLEVRRAAYRARADETTKALYAEGIEDVAQGGIIENAKQLGDTAPSFTLPNATGDSVSLDAMLADGPVVMVWYRGGWCPYCNITLHEYQEHLAEINALGATLVAISPEVPDKSLDTQQKNELEFQVLSDLNNAVAKQFGVVFNLHAGVKENYANFFSFKEVYGRDTAELPLAATYVIDTDRTIRYAFLDADYTKRAEPSEVLETLRGLK